MAFPGTPLEIKTELLIDGAWSDVSGDVYNREPMQITHGRADEAARADVSKASFTLNNRDGKYSPRNYRSPLYGKIGRNTPVRISVFGGESYLALDGNPANYAQTPSTSALNLPTGLDLRAEVSMDWRVPNGNQTIIGKWEATGNQRSYMLRVLDLSGTGDTHQIRLAWSPDGTTQKQAFFNMGFPPRRCAVRMTLDYATGTIKLYTADTLAGPWIDRGTTSTGTAETVFASTAPLRVAPNDQGNIPARNPLVGSVHRAEVYNGTTLVAAPDFRNIVAGSTSFTDSTGKAWTLGGTASISNRHTRFEGEISSWPSRWDLSGTDVWVPIQAAGIRRRLGQGVKPLDSTLRRRVPSGNPIAYWPMEESGDTTRAYSPLPNVKPLRTLGVDFAADDTLGGAGPVPKATGAVGQFTADVPHSANVGWHVEMPIFVPALPASEKEFFRVKVANAGTAGVGVEPVVAVVARISTAGIRVSAINIDNQQLVSFSNTTAQALADFAGKWNRLQLFTTTDGSSTYLNLRWVDIQNTGSYWLSRTVITGSPGRPTQVIANFAPGIPDVSFGHLAVFDKAGTVAAGGAINTTAPGVTIYDGADDGFLGEDVVNRMWRVTKEEGVPTQIGAFESYTPMGPQRTETLLSLLDRCEDADGGMVADSREGRALWFRGRMSLFNQRPKMVLDYSSGREVAAPFEPVEDDQGIRNDVTRSRIAGAEYRTVLADGPLSIQAPPLGVGTYDESIEVSVRDDDQLRDLAGWALHLGTWDEARFPLVNVRLHGAPQLIDDVLMVELLDRIDIINPPPEMPPGSIRLMVQGYTEVLSLSTWEIAYNCSPYGPWDVVVTDQETPEGHTDTEGCELVQAITPSSTELVVKTTSGPEWTSTHRDYPFDVSVAGEPMTVVGPGKLLNGNPHLVTDISGWSASAGGTIAEDTTIVHSALGATRSIKVTPDGVSATGGTVAALSGVGSVVVGAQYVVSGWVYSTNGWTDLRACVDWHDSAGVFLSSSIGTGISVPAGQWTYHTQVLTAPASASQARARIRHGATPPSSNPYYVWGVRLTPLRASYILDTFNRTLTDSWGAAEVGGAWSISGGTAPGDYDVVSGRGTHVLGSVNTSRRSYLTTSITDVDLRVDIQTSAVATGAAITGGLTARHTSSDDLYTARVAFNPDLSVTLTIRKRVAAVETELALVVPKGVTYAANTDVRLRFKVEGSTLRAKVWNINQTEPAWQLTTTDTSLTASAFLGCRSISLSGNTNASPVVRYTNLDVTGPQRLTVIRGLQGEAIDHAAGADVRLTRPTVISY